MAEKNYVTLWRNGIRDPSIPAAKTYIVAHNIIILCTENRRTNFDLSRATNAIIIEFHRVSTKSSGIRCRRSVSTLLANLIKHASLPCSCARARVCVCVSSVDTHTVLSHPTIVFACTHVFPCETV